MKCEYLAVGADISVNHSAIVVLTPDGQILRHFYLTEKLKDTKATLGGTRVLTMSRNFITRTQFEITRLIWLRDYYETVMDAILKSAVNCGASGIYCAMEGYAFKLIGARVTPDGKKLPPMTKGKPYQIGEAASVVKILAHDYGMKLRLHDPTSVKMFATGAGNAAKETVTEASSIMWQSKTRKEFPFPAGDVSGDVGDALALAEMARVEQEVRSGRTALSELPQGQRRVFIRTTTANPINILDTPWA